MKGEPSHAKTQRHKGFIRLADGLWLHAFYETVVDLRGCFSQKRFTV
jgi:hypothetical protein